MMPGLPRGGQSLRTAGCCACTNGNGGKTVLLVEDDDLVRLVFRRILQCSGFFVLEAGGRPRR